MRFGRWVHPESAFALVLLAASSGTLFAQLDPENPESPIGASAVGTTLTWTAGDDTDEFLVLESDDIVPFAPVDGACYDSSQIDCLGEPLGELPQGASVISTGCDESCSAGTVQTVAIVSSSSSKVYYIVARNVTSGNYSDVAITTATQATSPSVSILVSPLEGDSPLTVNFRGNALSPVPIDETRTVWDFDILSPPEVDASTRNASHTYEAADGETRIFIARLTMYDENGMSGSADVAITVHGGESNTDGEIPSEARINVGLPGTPDSDVSSGTSPFDVVLSIDASSLPGTLQAISWDLGDGTTSSGLTVPHTYINEGTVNLRIPITATITTITSASTTVNTTASRIITVQPGAAGQEPGEVDDCELPGTCADGEGGSANLCGIGALMPMTLIVFGLSLMRRKMR